MNKLLDVVQRRFGKITKEKIIANAIIGTGLACVFAFIWWTLATVSDAIRPWLIAGYGAITITYVFLTVRNVRRKQKIVKLPKIPIRQDQHETYIEARRPNTAPIPVVAERQPANETRSMPTTDQVKRPSLKEVELSKFARTQIAQENHLIVNRAVFEVRRPAKELFFPIEKRKPRVEVTGAEKVTGTNRTRAKTRIKRKPRRTIYGESLFVLLSIGILTLPTILNSITLPEWIVMFYAPPGGSQIAPLIILGLGGIFTVSSFFLFYRKWAYWYYWRLILILTNPSASNQGYLIVVDKPPLLGGSVPMMDLQKINQCYTTTAPTQEDEKGLRSMWVRILGVRWLIIDVFGKKDDERFNWMGPIDARIAAQVGRIINDLSLALHRSDHD